MESIRRRKPSMKPIETNGKATEAAEEEPLSPSARLFHEPNFNVHVIGIMGLKSRINSQVIKEHLPHTLLKHPRFSSLQVVDEKKNGEMKWVRTKVDLDKHIVVPQVDEQNLQESPDKFVENYIQNLSTTTLDKSKPMWDLHLLNVKTSDAEAVGIFRIHHSIGDGTSLISLLLACMRQTADPDKLPTIPGNKKRPSIINSSGHFTKGLQRYVMKIWYFMKLVWYTMVDVLMFIATVMFLKDTNTPIKGRPGSEFNPRRIVYGTALADMMDKDTEAKWGNWVGFVLLPFKIALRDDPLEYVREAKATIDRKKNSLEAIYTFSISEIALKLFGIKTSSSISHKIITNTTMCFSCLPGPQEEIGFYGHPLANLAPGSYGQPHMTIVLSVDESVIPDPHQLADDFEQSLKLFKDAVVERGLCHE
ncbi:hypothetical protein RND71_040574 [Anisodus tanguticus]|uniref:Diacylglycerol O-acyltransferase n=1 Tax=Anisodus tanguticus TaxID=243964 RepID=A0AAE1UQD0_9SOLA|nr:hypothetical protein RND71_040574 [Anisodus tanguticus]